MTRSDYISSMCIGWPNTKDEIRVCSDFHLLVADDADTIVSVHVSNAVRLYQPSTFEWKGRKSSALP